VSSDCNQPNLILHITSLTMEALLLLIIIPALPLYLTSLLFSLALFLTTLPFIAIYLVGVFALGFLQALFKRSPTIHSYIQTYRSKGLWGVVQFYRFRSHIQRQASFPRVSSLTEISSPGAEGRLLALSDDRQRTEPVQAEFQPGTEEEQTQATAVGRERGMIRDTSTDSEDGLEFRVRSASQRSQLSVLHADGPLVFISI
jgi:hypothetical protein